MTLAETLSSYATRISEVERVLIAHSPVRVPPGSVTESAYLPPDLQELRYQSHLRLPRLSGLLRRGLDAEWNHEGFGVALAVAAAELRLQTVAGWPGFVLLMHRLAGDAILPWLPAIFLAATALPGRTVVAFDPEDLRSFTRLI